MAFFLLTSELCICNNMSCTHGSIRMQALESKHMSPRQKTIDIIKSRPTNSRLFTSLCDEMVSEDVILLTHTDIR